MANVNAPSGFTPSRSLTGAHFTVNQYPIASAYATALFNGDPVKLSSGNIVAAAAGDTILGIFMGCEYSDPNSNTRVYKNTYPGSVTASDIVATVVDNPYVTFTVQTSASVAQSNVSQYADFVAGTGSTTTGKSGAQLDSTSISGTQGSLGFQIVRVDPIVGNAAGTNAVVEVRAVKHLFK